MSYRDIAVDGQQLQAVLRRLRDDVDRLATGGAIKGPVSFDPVIRVGDIWVVTATESGERTLTFEDALTGATVVPAGAAASARVLNHKPFSADVPVTATSEPGNPVVVCDPVTLNGATPVLVEFYAPGWFNNSTTRTLVVYLTDGTSVLGTIYHTGRAANAEDQDPATGGFRYTPAAGTYNFTALAWANIGTNVTIRAGAGGSGGYAPGYLRVTRDN